ncbi:hypothetical protein [Runella zeae]|uniref:hypothetical protein n=1 Tax=Runella zeae TaxID=94255 RepID=UPI00235663D5|nr:hypothetical protein [Runella zeae]
MLSLLDEIKQQEAAVEMLRIFVRNKRAKPEELEKAEATLKKLKGKANAEEVAARPVVIATPEPPKSIMVVDPVGTDIVETVFRRKGELMSEIKRLTAEQNELSNRLHEVDQSVQCGTLTANIVSLRRQIEKLWTEYRFIERNGQLPLMPQEPKQDPEKEVKLLRISMDLRSLRDKRLKLEKKIEKPHLHTKFAETKVPEWQTELVQVREAIAELEHQKDQFP